MRQLLPLCLYEMGLGRMEWQGADSFGPALVRSGSCNVRLLARYLTQQTFISSPLWRLKLMIKRLTNCILFRSLFPKFVTLTLVFMWFSVYICLVLYLMLCSVSLLLPQNTSLLGPLGTLTSQVCCCYLLSSGSSYPCSHS